MLSIIPLAFYFFASVSCLPFFTSNLFNIGCSKPIQQELDLVQGFKPELNNPANFGYIYRLDTPTLKLGPDIKVDLSSPAEKTEVLPSQAAGILSSISYNEKDSKLVVRGRISKLNANQLEEVSSEGTIMTLGFATFGRRNHGQWYSKLTGSITAKVLSLNIVHQTDGQDNHQELIIELTPEQNTNGINEYLKYAILPTATVKRINWTGSGSCGRVKSNKRDQFHEIIESAVLL